MAATNKTGFVIRFAIVYFIIVIGFVLVLAKITQIQGPEREQWLALSDSLRRVHKQVDVEPNRGNIYSSNGELMASTVPSYYLFMDFQTPALRINSGKLFYDNIDSLAYCLSRMFKDKSVASYKSHLLKGYNQKKRHYAINRIKVSHASYKEIKQFPLFRIGYRSGLIAEKRIKRIRPYGSLASVTIGSLYSIESKGAYNGLEAAFDSILSGKAGKAHYERKAGVNVLIADEAPENGADLTTTLHIDMQDISEKALREKLIQLDADLGCVVLMEVKTGQIKAIVNLKKVAEGEYREIENFVLRYRLEPGSTQKIPSLMAALEDGVVKPKQTVDCGDGTWQFSNEVLISDHNTGEKGNGVIPVEQVIVRSSNVGIAKIIDGGYKDNPQSFVNSLRKMGVGMPIDLGFSAGVANSAVTGPKENPLWGPSDLASMAYGYSLTMPLLYTLTFYNAIANNGQMMQPYLVDKLSRNGVVLKQFEPVVMKKSICSPKTLVTIKDIMLQVVEDSLHGTGKPVKSDFVRIAGKTGTARYNYKAGEVMRHQVSFCGFYPYENPEYSCIVFIRNPRNGVPSGGGMAGSVFKEIAERVMASHSMLSIHKFPLDSMKSSAPKIKKGHYDELKMVLSDLQFSLPEAHPFSPWVSMEATNKAVQVYACNFAKGMVPDVRGMTAKDALYILEKEGLKVRLNGKGKVYMQSILPGTPITKGRIIELSLQ